MLTFLVWVVAVLIGATLATLALGALGLLLDRLGVWFDRTFVGKLIERSWQALPRDARSGP